MPTHLLLSHLTPVTIIDPSTSEVFDFELVQVEWPPRATEGTVQVNEWLGEVEGWNREWRRTYRESKDIYLPQIGLKRDGKQAWAASERMGKALCWMAQNRFGGGPFPKMQRQGAAEVENGGSSEPDQIDDKKFQELDRQRRLADDERVGFKFYQPTVITGGCYIHPGIYLPSEARALGPWAAGQAPHFQVVIAHQNCSACDVQQALWW